MKEFKVLSTVDHVLLRPEMYVGGTTTKYITDWVYSEAEKKMVYKDKVKYNEGLVKIIFEAIDNAVDNSMVKENPTTVIHVNVDGDEVTVSNNGVGIPIERKDLGNGECLYIPTTIFGVPRSGSNYNEDRDGIGVNGLGIKLTNILSTKFEVMCINEGKTFSQQWSNHMKDRQPEKIKNSAPKKPNWTTKVKFTPDLSYFHKGDNECNVENIEKDLGEIIHTRLVSLSVTHPNPIKIYYNGTHIKHKGIKAYMKLFTEERTFYEAIPGAKFEYGLTLSNNGTFQHQSFVNCQRTVSDKSSHTRYVTNKVTKAISDYLKKKHPEVGSMISSNVIANYLHVFVNLHMKNPKFTSQTKVELSSNIPAKDYPIDAAKVVGLAKKSGLIQSLEQKMFDKAVSKAQSKLNISKCSSLTIEKLDDAQDAGKATSKDTVLFLVEGDSAKTFVANGMSVIGRKKFGVFPLKGKLLNTLGCSVTKLTANAEIVNVMKILGLNLEKTYETPQDRATLRYDKVCILTDADHDGLHICGLLLTLFQNRWPALLKSGYVLRFVTPVIKATNKRNGKVKTFFTMEEYANWASGSTDLRNWFVQHLKGLGTSEPADTVNYFKAMKAVHLKNFTVDEDITELVHNIFDKKRSDWRKEWISAPLDQKRLDYTATNMSISTFLKTEMYDFSSYNITRGIPHAVDGLKVSQRKIMFTCLEKFKGDNTPMKVAQLGAKAAGDTNYAHGEISIQKAVVVMAQSWPGSNNLPLLMDKGAFGSRLRNGSDAASPRYIFTCLRPYTKAVMGEISPEVLSYKVEENMSVEPHHYVPALPLVLLNGSNGIGTGFNTLIPCFKLDDIIHNVKCKVDTNLQPRKLLPWYSEPYSTNSKTREEEKRWVFEGHVEKITATKWVIKEIPIGVSIDSYKEKVLNVLVAKKIISSAEPDHPSPNEPRFILEGVTIDFDHAYDVLKLRNTMTKNTMNLIGSTGRVVNFKSPEEILDYWYQHRVDHLEKVKQYKLRVMGENIKLLDMKIKFVQAVVRGDIEIRNASKENLRRVMLDQLKIPEEFHQRFLMIPLVSITKEKYEELLQEKATAEHSLKVFQGKTIATLVKETIEECKFEVKPNLKRQGTTGEKSNKKVKR
jgi:DNA topoisomerase-2